MKEEEETPILIHRRPPAPLSRAKSGKEGPAFFPPSFVRALPGGYCPGQPCKDALSKKSKLSSSAFSLGCSDRLHFFVVFSSRAFSPTNGSMLRSWLSGGLAREWIAETAAEGPEVAAAACPESVWLVGDLRSCSVSVFSKKVSTFGDYYSRSKRLRGILCAHSKYRL